MLALLPCAIFDRRLTMWCLDVTDRYRQGSPHGRGE